MLHSHLNINVKFFTVKCKKVFFKIKSKFIFGENDLLLRMYFPFRKCKVREINSFVQIRYKTWVYSDMRDECTCQMD
jgi:hypothetical protein